MEMIEKYIQINRHYLNDGTGFDASSEGIRFYFSGSETTYRCISSIASKNSSSLEGRQ
jgi:hypothetical protein